MRREVARAQQTQGNRDRRRQHRAPQGDADGDQALPRVLADVGERGMEIALEEDADVADVPHELEGAQLDDPSRPAQDDGHGEGRQERPPQLGAARRQGGYARGMDRREGSAHEIAHRGSAVRTGASAASLGLDSPRMSTTARSVSSTALPLKTSLPWRKPTTRSA